MCDAPKATCPTCPQCAAWGAKWVEVQAQLAALTAKVAERDAVIAKLEAEVRDLKARLNQNSSNSSRPPSSDAPWQRPKSTSQPGRKAGGQTGHTGFFRKLLPREQVTRTVPHLPSHCAHCGAGLSKDAGPNDPAPTRFQVAELPERPVEIIEHEGHARVCQKCGKVTRADIPAEVRAHVCGPNLGALISFLRGRSNVTARKMREFLKVVMHVPLSLGSVINYQKEMSTALAPAAEEANRAVRAAPVVNVDETGWFLRGRTRWLWVAASQDAVSFMIQDTRGLVGLRTLLGEHPPNFVISDRWYAYNMILMSLRQSCWSHLGRDFAGLVEHGGGAEVALGLAGVHANARLFDAWSDFKAGNCGRAALQERLEPVQSGLRQDLQHARDGPKGRARRFAGRLLGLYQTLWNFVSVPGVEPTNNHAERQGRPAVLWRKVSFGSQSEAGCRFAERMLSVVGTLHLRGRDIFSYLTAALRAHREHLPCPALCASAAN